MIVLHGGFSRTFFAWGERAFAVDDFRAPPDDDGWQPRDHPWSAGPDWVRAALADAGFACRRECRVWELELPAPDGRFPLPSSHLLGELPEDARSWGACALRRWRVCALVLGAEDFLALTSLPLAPPTDDGVLAARGVLFAPDLCYLLECCRFAVSLLERGRFLPDILASSAPPEKTRYETLWRPLFIDDDAERFDRLARRLPDVLRASSSPEQRPAAHEVLCDVLDAYIDGLVRRAWQGGRRTDAHGRALAGRPGRPARKGAARPRRGRLVSARNPHALWIRSLGWNGETEALAQAFDEIYPDVREWWDRFAWLEQASFRLCLRLEEGEAHWRLSYALRCLQAEEEIAAEEVWRMPCGDRGGISGDFARRYLLMLLGRAGTCVEAIRRSLREYAPDGCDLSLEEASAFLGEQASALAELGVAVRLPAWWRERGGDGLLLRGRVVRGAVAADAFDRSRNTEREERLALVWDLVLDDEALLPEEELLLADSPLPLCRIRGRWVFVRRASLHRILHHRKKLPVEATPSDALRLALVDPFVGGFDGAPALEEAYATMREGRSRFLLEEPEGFAGTLRPYQLQGYSWMAFLADLGLGACLADDMGLGKTIQALALIRRCLVPGERRPVLLVCPTSVMENWRQEAARFFPGLRCLLHHGRNRAKGRAFVETAENSDIVLTGYPLLHRDLSFYREVRWRGVVLDEAQSIKNPDTKQARAARSIAADWRVVLTGTPVENHVGDLWSIMEFLMPGLLGSRRWFDTAYVRPIQERRDTARMDDLRRQIAPFVMRRMKTDPQVAPELPERIETKVWCGLKREQARLYAQITASLDRNLAGMDGFRRRGIVLGALTRIKQVCDHPALATKDGDFSAGRSAKLERLIELAAEMFETGDRALIFTQYVEMGDILKDQLQECFGKEVFFLHGGVEREARDRMVRRFQEDSGPRFFVLSLKAGGVGLNLTGANHVVMYDRWWNPAVERQAIDRVHRIGQRKNVQVHIFCCQGTLEERIDAMLAAKREIAEHIVEGSDRWFAEMSDDELRQLLALSSTAVEA